MNTLSWLFVNKPFNILAVAVVLAIAWLALRSTAWGASHRPAALLVPAVAWGLYGIWEWAVVRWSPEADIRVDLLLIWPLVGILSLWGLWRLFRPAG